MKNSILLTLSVVAILASGCASTNGRLNGMWYKDMVDSGGATSEAGSKTGESCASSILGFVATGDASISAAKKAGGISKVSSFDHKDFSILGFYASTCTVVHGN